MRAADSEVYRPKPFSLTQMIYTVCGGIIAYRVLQFVGWFFFSRAQKIPWGLSRFHLWFYATNLFYALIMFAIGLPYRPKSELFVWSPPRFPRAFPKCVGLGLAGGLATFVLASPPLWQGDRQLEFIRLLMADALSPLGALDAILFIVALAVSTEMVFRGIVFRTLAEYTTVPAAILGSCLLFAYLCPLWSFPAAIILGIISAILYYRTRNLLASIVANAVFTLGGGGLTLYRSLMHR